MISFSLHGELGNQMFQWATGVSFARAKNQKIAFRTLPGVSFRLSEFEGSADYEVRETTSKEIFASKVLSLANVSGITRKLRLYEKLANEQREQTSNFEILEFVDGKKYHGYFQSWRYFHHEKQNIERAFRLKEASTQLNTLYKSLPEDFTAVHVRRGGPGKAVLATDFHGLLDYEYYDRAINLSRRLGAPENYLVFTDNLESAAKLIENLNLPKHRFITGNDLSSQCENLILMSQAKQIIGANSSYSWWAAYLNSAAMAPPVFPRQWYMDPTISTNDMLLPDWISVGASKFLNEEAVRGYPEDAKQ